MIETLIAEPALEERVKTPFVSLWMDKDGFLNCRYAEDTHLTLDVAVSVVESRIFFAKGLSYPVLIDMRGIKSTTRKAREYLATIGSTLVKAGALVTGSPINRALGNIFLSIDKPMVPTKLFTDETNAKLWLKKFQ